MVGARTSRRDHLVGCAWFWAWALLGSAVTLGALSLGPILAAPLLVIGWLMASRPAIRRLWAPCRAGNDLLAHTNCERM
jgi:hypothetical protein